MTLFLIFLVGAWGGAQNALAGGGSFLILPTLMFSGLDARAANITSCIALFPAQVATGWAGRTHAGGVAGLSLKALFAISTLGGALGAAILLLTPSSFFARLVPWLVLFSTGVFIWGSFFRKATKTSGHISPIGGALAQFAISVYGGYFGGGIGFLMMAELTLAGESARTASATKNVLAGVMNASAVLIFLFSSQVGWPQALATAAGATLGGLFGVRILHRLNERMLRLAIAVIGVALTVGLFLTQG